MKMAADIIQALDKIPVSLIGTRALWWNHVLEEIKKHNYSNDEKYQIKLETEDSGEIKDIVIAFELAAVIQLLVKNNLVKEDDLQAVGEHLGESIAISDKEIFWGRYVNYSSSPDVKAFAMRVSNDLARATTKKENPLPEAIFISSWVASLILHCEHIVLRSFGKLEA
jgi:hypothetical protein